MLIFQVCSFDLCDKSCETVMLSFQQLAGGGGGGGGGGDSCFFFLFFFFEVCHDNIV